MTKKSKKINQENLANVASDAISDLMHSLLTDVVNKMQDDGVILDLDRAIEIVDEVSATIGVEGVRLRRANVERRNVSRRSTKVDNKKSPSVANVTWVPHPKDKKLEYTKAIEIGKRYVLRKVGTNRIMGLLDKTKVDDKKLGYGLKDDNLTIVNSAEMLMLRARGFEMDKRVVAAVDDSEEEDSEEDSDEEEDSDVEDSDEEEEEPVVSTHRGKSKRK
ncbi:hypothetical protein K457DRAFT_26560 [Linnemannia elongata AG-77]|uniref:Uncharacterized protein n=1 Tax=Linnemannia elongata AG-77 TaxID=1314771 RepID=A0A197JA54_9FUNG|nr:hypothetical protein K457DRAFT_26560 [Linnemannia elongata AG-77]